MLLVCIIHLTCICRVTVCCHSEEKGKEHISVGELLKKLTGKGLADIKGLFVCDIRDFLSGGHKGTFRMRGHYALAF